ncbi:MAG: GNAT family N-acetyltransferase [Rhabdaerophilum calidifontis]
MAAASAFSRVAIHAGETALARLAAARAGSPFQGSIWLGAWLAAHDALATLRVIEIADEAGAALLLPVGLVTGRAGIAACKLGGAHASFYVPAVRGEQPPALPAGALRAALRAGGRAIGADLVILTECPAHWNGAPHPLAPLFTGRSPSDGAELKLAAGESDPLRRLLDREARKKLRAKQRKFAALGPPRFGWVTGTAEVRTALDAFLGWKARQFAAMGVADPFAGAAIRAFLERSTTAEPPAIQLFAASTGDIPRAVLGIAGDATRLSVMFAAYDPEPAIARLSPGELAFAAAIEAAAAAGIRHFDLGVGEARYKTRYAPEMLMLHDLVMPVTARGRGLALLFRAYRGAKRLVKRHPRLLTLARRLAGGRGSG